MSESVECCLSLGSESICPVGDIGYSGRSYTQIWR